MRMIIVAVILAVVMSQSAALASEKIEGRATVIDGDTIAVEGTDARIRLYGIDTPEKGQSCEDASGKSYLCGSRAAKYLASMIGRNGRVRCFEEDRDRYGRIVAECATRDNRVINAEMVKAGWAIEYREYSDGRYDHEEAEAKAAGRGMWAGRFVEPAKWRRGERLSAGAAIGAPVEVAASGRSCKAMRSCEDAVRLWCSGYSRADGDHDGIPCENVCRSKAEVDAIRKKIGC